MLVLSIESSCDETSLAIMDLPVEDELGLQSFGDSLKTNIVQAFGKITILGHIISSQVSIHAQYGGVVPEIGAREHAEVIHLLFDKVIQEAVNNYSSDSKIPKTKQDVLDNIQYIFVTTEPGLKAGLRVGQEFAKSVQFYLGLNNEEYPVNFVATPFPCRVQGSDWSKSSLHFLQKGNLQKNTLNPNKKVQIIEVNHLNGHIFSAFWNQSLVNLGNKETQAKTALSNAKDNSNQNLVFPQLHLLVSGGNTQLIEIDENLNTMIIARTLDDASGECFDKCARMLGLDYPGGATLSRIAGVYESKINTSLATSNNSLVKNKTTNTPKPKLQYLSVGMMNSDPNFSYSGLKTALRYAIESITRATGLLTLEKKLTAIEITNLLDSSYNLSGNPKLELVAQLCYEAQYCIIQQLYNKTKLAIINNQKSSDSNYQSLGLSGGVSANPLLRFKFQNELQELLNNQENQKVYIAPLELTGDNAVMIALAGIVKLAGNKDKT